MKKKRGCPHCGGTKTAPAVDNHGQPYVGYVCCRLLTMQEIEKLIAVNK